MKMAPNSLVLAHLNSEEPALRNTMDLSSFVAAEAIYSWSFLKGYLNGRA